MSTPADAARTTPRFPRPTSPRSLQQARALEKSKSWLVLALAAVLGAVLAVACAVIVMRQKPRYLALSLPEAQEELRLLGDFPSLPRPGFLSLTELYQPNRASLQVRHREINWTAQSGSEPANWRGCKQPPATGNGPSRDADRLR